MAVANHLTYKISGAHKDIITSMPNHISPTQFRQHGRRHVVNYSSIVASCLVHFYSISCFVS